MIARFAAAVLAVAVIGTAAHAQDAKGNDYPTIARADYVFACMQVNGRSRQILEKCSCSIDVIADLLPYDKYEEAETIMSVRQKGGEAVAPLMTPEYQEKILEMKRAQVEGELRCF
jgi:hypothetical protein